MNYYGLIFLGTNDKLTQLYLREDDKIYSLYIRDEIINSNIYWYMESDGAFYINQDEEVIDAIFSRAPIYQNQSKDKYRLVTLNPAGTYLSRVYRPLMEPIGRALWGGSGISLTELRKEINKYQTYHPNNIEFSIKSLTQLTTLKRMLTLIFSNIYPTTNNLATFGHTIKDLIILACIEIEAQLKGIYLAHKTNPKDKPYFSNYYELKELLKLAEYSVSLPLYPELPSFSPFKNWMGTNAKNTPPEWYDAYNGIKHNHDSEFIKATLGNAISAVCALVVIFKAQYGDTIPYWQEEIGNFFTVSNSIEWSYAEHLLPPLINTEWTVGKINL